MAINYQRLYTEAYKYMPGFSDSARAKLAEFGERLLILVIVLLPWQARFIQEEGFLGGTSWEQATRSFYAVEALILAALILHILSRGNRKDCPNPPVFLRFWSLLMIFALLSILWASNAVAAGNAWVHLFEGFALAYLIWRSRLRVRILLYAFIIGASANAILGLWQFLTQSSFASTFLGVAMQSANEAGVSVIETAGGRFLRAYGLLPHPNVFGGYMAVALFASVGLVVEEFRKRTEMFLLGAVALFVFGLIVSFSRAAWVAYAIAFLIFTLTRRDRQKQEEKRSINKTLILQTGAGLFALLLVAPLVMTRVSVGDRLERKSVNDRGLVAYQAIELTKKHYAAGVGIGNMPVAAFRELRPRLAGYSYQPAHNILLLVAAELGFFGFMMLIGAVLAWFGDARRMFRRAERPLIKMAAILPVILIVAGLFDHYPFTQFAGTLLAGFVFGLFLRAQEN